MTPKRKSYTAEFKLKMIKYAAENSYGAAGSLEGERNWSGRKALTAMKKSKKENHGLEDVHRWRFKSTDGGSSPQMED